MNIYALMKTAGVVVLKIALVAGLAFYLNHLGVKEGIALGKAEVAAEKTQAAEARTGILAGNVADTSARDAKTITKLEAQRAHFATLNKSLNERLAEQERTPYKTPENPNEQVKPPLLGQSVLDDGTVSLLNDARANRDRNTEPGGAAERGNAEVGVFTATAPFVTGRELAENDLEVVRKYHKLATRHDDLVDWVNVQCSRPVSPQK